MTAPSDADETSAAYFASTPPARARARAAGDEARGPSAQVRVDIETPRGDVEGDHVAVAHERDRPAAFGLGRHVARHHSVGGAAEAAVGHERHRVAEAAADERRGDREHLAHPRPAARPFVADDDDVARLDRPGLHRGERGLFAVEHARRARRGARGRDRRA